MHETEKTAPAGADPGAWGEAKREDIELHQGRTKLSADAALPLKEKWTKETAAARHLPGIHVEDGGECLFLNRLSPGCRACKNGEWDCIFVTMACQMKCAFCWRPRVPKPDHLGSAFARQQKDLANAYAQTRISGISFSGGEVFLEPAALFEWIRWATAEAPGRYYWLYTNGRAGTEQQLAQAAKLGIHEVRFNLAASGYTDPAALKRLRFASRHFSAVTVEIPAIPEDARQLLDAIPRWCEAGASYLNLHELVYEPGTYSADMPGARRSGTLGDGHVFFYHPGSRALTLTVMERVAMEHLPLGVNDCSLHSKRLQIQGRRRALAPLLKQSWDRIISGARLETYGICGESSIRLFHPARLGEVRRANPRARLVRLIRRAPLSAAESPQWLSCETL